MNNIASSADRLRDPRVDFFRGLALIFIFIDHIPDNTCAYLTLRNFGFADASEVFVLLSGYSAALAYGAMGDALPLRHTFTKALARARKIYVWHIGIFVVSAVLLYGAAAIFSKPTYVYNIWLQNLAIEPLEWSIYALMLIYQPNQMNILPLYIVLMLWLPLMLVLLRKGVIATLLVSVAIWALANTMKINLPVNTPGDTWFFNPFAWQLLFTTGAVAAVLARRQTFAARDTALAIAIFYVAFSFIYAAPWVPISWLPNDTILPPDLLGTISKPDLSAWRFLHVIALAYLAGALIPATAPWLSGAAASAVSLCGRYALEIFAAGTVLSFAAWIVLEEIGTTTLRQWMVTSAGIAAMILIARRLSERSELRLMIR